MIESRGFNYLHFRKWACDGYSYYAMSQIKALAQVGAKVYPGLLMELDETPGWYNYLRGLDMTRLNVVLAPPHDLKAMPGRVFSSTMYESTRIPDDWATHVNTKAERLIVPCQWCADVFRDNGVTTPIHIIPGGVDPVEFPATGIPLPTNRPYTFLAFGDRGSRKGQDLVWEAFYNVFGDNPDVRLIVKTRQGGLPWLSTAKGDRRVTIWREDVPHMADVYAHVDCVVNPTKGEGWGLFPREAACTGKPVICTAIGGTLDGIEHWGIPIVNYKMVPAAILGGGEWAMPDVEEVGTHMRWCYDHREEAWQKGQQAAVWLREHQTWQHSAQQLMTLIEEWG
jgi:glycosyltransferase involved in cell wall biosynthesis